MATLKPSGLQRPYEVFVPIVPKNPVEGTLTEGAPKTFWQQYGVIIIVIGVLGFLVYQSR